MSDGTQAPVTGSAGCNSDAGPIGEEQEGTIEVSAQEIINKLGEVKQAVIGIVQANQSPTSINICRQFSDHLDAAYLFLTSLFGAIDAQNQAVEQKVADGNVVQFPGKPEA